ncbi:MAG: hypothetical protein ACOX52_14430 [Verrucomicrobiota bacterium]
MVAPPGSSRPNPIQRPFDTGSDPDSDLASPQTFSERLKRDPEGWLTCRRENRKDADA